MNSLHIARREIAAYFNTPAAYVVLSVFLLILGYLFFSTLFLAGTASMRGFFSQAPLMLVIFAPAITMRLFAEEKKSGTNELLLTLPVTNFEVVLGKFLAALAIIGIGFLFTLPYAISTFLLSATGSFTDYGPIVGGYVGLLFLSGSFLALGLWASSLTKNQIIAFIIGLGLCFFFYFVDKFAVLLPSIAAVLQYISVDYHFNNIARGVIDSRDLVFYLSLIIIFLLLTEQTLSRDRK